MSLCGEFLLFKVIENSAAQVSEFQSHFISTYSAELIVAIVLPDLSRAFNFAKLPPVDIGVTVNCNLIFSVNIVSSINCTYTQI
jgi:hypothetical protein